MNELTHKEIISEIRDKQYHPVYFLTGDEPYYIDVISDYIQENVLTEEEKTFNQTIVYGKETSARAVMDAAKRFPMMSSHQVVIVKEAQEMKDFDDLRYYIEKPLSSTLLVLNYKYKSPGKKMAGLLKENSVFFQSKKIYENKLPEWITGYLAHKKVSIEPKAAAIMVEHTGNDLSRLVNELDKLLITQRQDPARITPFDIERNIGISKDYNNFELQKALGVKDAVKANRIIHYFIANPKESPVPVTMATLYNFFSRLLVFFWIREKSDKEIAATLGIPYFAVKEYRIASGNYSAGKVIEIIDTMREYDVKTKGFGGCATPPGELLKEMIFKILH